MANKETKEERCPISLGQSFSWLAAEEGMGFRRQLQQLSLCAAGQRSRRKHATTQTSRFESDELQCGSGISYKHESLTHLSLTLSLIRF